jgi:hypothetical protein
MKELMKDLHGKYYNSLTKEISEEITLEDGRTSHAYGPAESTL